MRSHRYRVTVEHLARPDGTPPPAPATLRFETGQHDNLLAIVERVRARGDLPDEEAAAFAVGLKLFGEVLLHHRDLPLFAGIAPAFRAFMQQLKQRPASAG